MDRFYNALDQALTAVLIVLVILMVFSITAEIVLNAILQPSTSYLLATFGENEFLESSMGFVALASAPINTASQTLLVWIGILGSALAFRYRSHLGVDALVRLYPYKVRLILDYAAIILVGLFSLLVLVIGGYLVCEGAFSRGSKMPGIEAINRGWFYLVLIFTGILNLLYCAYHIKYPKPVGEPVEQEGGQK